MYKALIINFLICKYKKFLTLLPSKYLIIKLLLDKH